MDCERWALREAKRLGKTLRVELLWIRPGTARVIGGIRIPPDDEFFWPAPPWHYHCAVYSHGIVRDELYPDGLPLRDYKSKFEHHDALDFVLEEVT
jgi:hypothetical protein